MVFNNKLNDEEYIYVLSNPSFEKNIFKIGWTRTHPILRSEQLYNSGLPTPFNIECIIKTNIGNGSKLENKIHKELKQYRLNDKREFFQLDKNELYNIFNKLNLKYEEEFNLPQSINTKKVINNKSIREIINLYDQFEKEAMIYFNELEKSEFRHKSRYNKKDLIEQDLSLWYKAIKNVIDDKNGIIKRIGPKLFKEDTLTLKNFILDSLELINIGRIRMRNYELGRDDYKP